MLIKHFPVATLFIIVLKDSVSPVPLKSRSTPTSLHATDTITRMTFLDYLRSGTTGIPHQAQKSIYQ